MGLGGYTQASFNDAAQGAFIGGIAAAVGVVEDDVSITSIVEYTVGAGGRRLLEVGVNVGYSVAAADATAAAALSAAITTATANPTAFVATLRTAGLTSVTSAEVTAAPVVAAAPSLEVSAAAAGSGFALAMLVAVAITTLFA